MGIIIRVEPLTTETLKKFPEDLKEALKTQKKYSQYVLGKWIIYHLSTVVKRGSNSCTGLLLPTPTLKRHTSGKFYYWRNQEQIIMAQNNGKEEICTLPDLEYFITYRRFPSNRIVMHPSCSVGCCNLRHAYFSGNSKYSKKAVPVIKKYGNVEVLA